MPFVRDGRTLVAHAFDNRYTLPAFNVCTVEMVRACLEAAEEEAAPIILQTYPGDIEQIAPRQMVALVTSYAEEARVPVMLHLDHGQGLEMGLACLRAGYSSVMYDGADQPLDEVVALTRRLAEVAHLQGAAVEVAAESFNAGAVQFTRPGDALRLKQEGEADMIAVSVGSEHGQSGTLELELLEEIFETVQAPLVLHGGSGITAADYAAARMLGVVKANIGSALYRALRRTWETSADAVNHREVVVRARAALKEVAREKIHIMGAAGQAASFTLTR
ncbi:MAG: class II fructose-bisphosphate aldolase [Trueperaceae bacterium]|nr:MAG: class II fructose-bisphosphate aldolase [Trueperaceae bacterium]